MTKLFCALLTIILVGASAPAYAISPATAEAHNLLGDALVRRGISLYADSPVCQARPGLQGYYNGSERVLVICNGGSRQVTESSLDTLRHETVHFIQDCANGTIDNNLRTVLKPGKARYLLEQAGIDVKQISKAYTAMGNASHVPLEEEAYAIAATMQSESIALALEIFCPLH